MIGDIWAWLTTSAHWTGADGIWQRTLEHVEYTLIAVAVAAVIALPIGALIGHTGRGTGLVAGTANALRALPSLGLLVMLALWALGHLPVGIALQTASIAVLALLAIPPMLTSTYAGVAAVDPAARDAAEGMGMSGGQVLLRVELPIAVPLLFSGLRSAYLQAVATATIAAFVSLGGLGRYVIDGLAQHDYPKMAGGALLVAVLAVVGDRILAVVGHFAASAGLTSRRRLWAKTAPYRSSYPAASLSETQPEVVNAARQ
ncbi:MAG: ABC transporter permease [Actinobacteria bacterium 69-20]|nr:ABC transporter permease [Actinomycetota bacterium]OJV24984.1 MAG: ABC transporter permease [Actinobacteria bacterium 69-20]